jgi:hypothetical protein
LNEIFEVDSFIEFNSNVEIFVYDIKIERKIIIFSEELYNKISA